MIQHTWNIPTNHANIYGELNLQTAQTDFKWCPYFFLYKAVHEVAPFP